MEEQAGSSMVPALCTDLGGCLLFYCIYEFSNKEVTLIEVGLRPNVIENVSNREGESNSASSMT